MNKDAVDTYITEVLRIYTQVYGPAATPDPDKLSSAQDIYESALKVEGVREIRETLASLTPLFTAFVEGLHEAAASAKSKKD